MPETIGQRHCGVIRIHICCSKESMHTSVNLRNLKNGSVSILHLSLSVFFSATFSIFVCLRSLFHLFCLWSREMMAFCNCVRLTLAKPVRWSLISQCSQLRETINDIDTSSNGLAVWFSKVVSWSERTTHMPIMPIELHDFYFLIFLHSLLSLTVLSISQYLHCSWKSIGFHFRFETWMPDEICTKKWCNLNCRYRWWQNYKMIRWDIVIGNI